MSPNEIAWRVQSVVRDASDRFLLTRRGKPRSIETLLAPGHREFSPGFSACDTHPGAWVAAGAPSAGSVWLSALCERAERILKHRISLFDLEDVDLGDPIDWHRDYKSGRRGPLTFSPSIDYRDHDVTGDCKFVWEPNRHHHLVVLARAYRAAGDKRYAHEICRQIESWLDANPFGLGMNWRSPLELSIRLINWVWALDLIRPAGAPEPALLRRILQTAWLHMWDVARKYSRGSSANNHLIGEAAGVYVGARYFNQLRGADRWATAARQVLLREIDAQTYPDGVNRELAMGYHLFALEFFLIAGLAARRAGDEFPASYWSRLRSMFDFVAEMYAGGPLPMYGDADNGYVLDLGRTPEPVAALLSVGAEMFDSPRMARLAGGATETAYWLLGESAARCEQMARPAVRDPLRSNAFRDAGIYLLQGGAAGEADRISMTFDCGELGFKSIAAHGHADALHITIRVGGRDFLVDPGTYDYFTYPAWRNYFRSTRAHNTLTIDGLNQSEMMGSFMWGTRARARCIEWSPNAVGGRIVAEHDGYQRLSDPVTHRREAELDSKKGLISIADEIFACAAHDITLYFHIGDGWVTHRLAANRYLSESDENVVEFEIDPSLSVQTLVGSDDPQGGWVSRGYHRRSPCTTLIASCTATGRIVLKSKFVVRR
ncbi:MAG: alginate lyase family protein [Phycisphaerae bacterium]